MNVLMAMPLEVGSQNQTTYKSLANKWEAAAKDMMMYSITQIGYKMSKKGQVLFCPLDGATIS